MLIPTRRPEAASSLSEEMADPAHDAEKGMRSKEGISGGNVYTIPSLFGLGCGAKC